MKLCKLNIGADIVCVLESLESKPEYNLEQLINDFRSSTNNLPEKPGLC